MICASSFFALSSGVASSASATELETVDTTFSTRPEMPSTLASREFSFFRAAVLACEYWRPASESLAPEVVN